jgi:homoserine O-acetyltransferase
MTLDAIRTDPEWQDGNYTAQPRGLRTAIYFLQLVGLAPLQAQKNFSTREAADKNVETFLQARFATTDDNDFIYQVDSSRNYNPSPHLDKITAPLLHINSADDFINPPELGIAEREIAHVKRGRFILIPISDETRGHGTHTRARVWKNYLEELLKVFEK